MPRFIISAAPISNPLQNLAFYHNISVSKTLSISLQSESIILSLMVTITKLDVIKRKKEGLCPFQSMLYIRERFCQLYLSESLFTRFFRAIFKNFALMHRTLVKIGTCTGYTIVHSAESSSQR